MTSIPIYFRVVCKCGSCGPRKQRLSEWEKHTGCRARKWKYSVKVKATMLPLEQWVRINSSILPFYFLDFSHSLVLAPYAILIDINEISDCRVQHKWQRFLEGFEIG